MHSFETRTEVIYDRIRCIAVLLDDQFIDHFGTNCGQRIKGSFKTFPPTFKTSIRERRKEHVKLIHSFQSIRSFFSLVLLSRILRAVPLPDNARFEREATMFSRKSRPLN